MNTQIEYLNSLEGLRRKEIKALHALIRKTAPELKPVMVKGMLGYGPYHYTYASGREGDWVWLALASQKNYISFYVCAVEDGEYITAKYKKDLPKASIGKSCVRFKRLEDVDAKVLEKMIRHTAKLAKGASKSR